MSWEDNGGWSQLKDRIQARWAALTKRDVDACAGRRDLLSQTIQDRYGITRELADSEIEEFERAVTVDGQRALPSRLKPPP
jgi:uncharacterized protein YjbJ (UPF0337 family)